MKLQAHNRLVTTSFKNPPHWNFKPTIAPTQVAMQQGNDYCLFGAPMPGRQFNNGSYRFGFNGQEKTDEISGSGNHIDFDERGYDPRTGRWWSIDKYFAKYPYQSPYAFVGNNPILNKEIDGNDYGVYVDHTTKTIIVKATYYTPKGSADANSSAKSAAEFWNKQSDKYQYRVDNADGSSVFYDIKFDIKVEENNGPRDQRGQKYQDIDAQGNPFINKPDNNPESNTYGIVKDDSKKIEKLSVTHGGDVNGVAELGSMISVKQSRIGTSTEEHEMGHSLGSGHVDGTVLSTSSNSERQYKTSSNIIRNILGGVGIGKQFQSDSKATGKGTVVSEKGEAPENFKKGKTVDK